MKKLVLMAAAVVAVSFASCGGNKSANAEQAAADSIRIADSIAAVEAEAEEAAAACCGGDSVCCDSLKAAAEAAAE